MFRNLAANLVNHERIVTTDAKAKELRRVTERLISKAKRLGTVAYTPQAKLSDGDKARRLHVHRLVSSYLPRWGIEADGITKRDLVEKLLVELSRRFAERQGGYTRIIKLGKRKGDGASMSVIEFIDAPPVDAEDDDVDEPAAEAVAPAEAAADAETDAKAEADTDAEADEEADVEDADDEEKKDDE